MISWDDYNHCDHHYSYGTITIGNIVLSFKLDNDSCKRKDLFFISRDSDLSELFDYRERKLYNAKRYIDAKLRRFAFNLHKIFFASLHHD